MDNRRATTARRMFCWFTSWQLLNANKQRRVYAAAHSTASAQDVLAACIARSAHDYPAARVPTQTSRKPRTPPTSLPPIAGRRYQSFTHAHAPPRTIKHGSEHHIHRQHIWNDIVGGLCGCLNSLEGPGHYQHSFYQETNAPRAEQPR